MKYRKKPVVVEAKQYDGTIQSVSRLSTWMDAFGAAYRIVPYASVAPPHAVPFYVVTLEGEMLVGPGDYLIQGVQGEFYPCKPDIFEATYEPADPVG